MACELIDSLSAGFMECLSQNFDLSTLIIDSNLYSVKNINEIYKISYHFMLVVNFWTKTDIHKV